MVDPRVSLFIIHLRNTNNIVLNFCTVTREITIKGIKDKGCRNDLAVTTRSYKNRCILDIGSGDAGLKVLGSKPNCLLATE